MIATSVASRSLYETTGCSLLIPLYLVVDKFETHDQELTYRQVHDQYFPYNYKERLSLSISGSILITIRRFFLFSSSVVLGAIG